MLYHDDTDSFIENYTGSLKVQSNYVYINDIDGNNFIRCEDGANGYVSLHQNGGTKLKTTSGGIDVTGMVQADQFALLNDEKATYGDSNDLQVYHASGHNYIHSDVGDLNICVDTGSKVVIQSGTSGNHLAEFNFEGAAELFYNGHQALNTTADGIQVYGSDNSNCIIQLNSDLSTNYSDKYRLKLDDGGPLYIQNYNSGSG